MAYSTWMKFSVNTWHTLKHYAVRAKGVKKHIMMLVLLFHHLQCGSLKN